MPPHSLLPPLHSVLFLINMLFSLQIESLAPSATETSGTLSQFGQKKHVQVKLSLLYNMYQC